MKVTIRSWREDDAKALAELLNNKKIQDKLRDGIPFPYSENDALAFIRAMLSSGQEAFAFAIVADGELAGSVGIFRRGNIHRLTAELGYYVGERFWRKGIGSAAVKLACGEVFARSDVIRIFAEPFADNIASCRLLEACGFREEGVMRKNAVKCGEIKDMKLYALLKQ